MRKRSDSCTSSENHSTQVDRPPPYQGKIYTTWPDIIKHWPKRTFCIVSNEFCERFSYYGMRTVLTLYLLNVLKFSSDTSTVFFNAFTVLCYLTPMLGSVIADGYIGKYKTIMFVSLIYAAGQIILTLASTNNYKSKVHPLMDMAGLIIIAFGTGGIKPCVSSFGGDQFDRKQVRMLSLFFSMFYFSINAGSMISSFMTPIFRSQPCLNQDSCYPLAFGIPAALMIVATVVFAIGSYWYTKPPPTENIFAEVTYAIKGAIVNKMRFNVSRPHWMDHYMDTHSCEYDEKCLALRKLKRNKTECHKRKFIDDVKSLLRVAIMYLPVPMFWALYDQQGSRWTIQAIQMNCKLWGNALLLPDQMQVLNAVLILAFIPLFQIVIYPIVGKCVTLTPLRKMVAGGILAAGAFVLSAFIQLKINTTLPDLPGKSGNTPNFVSFVNTIPGCNFTVTSDVVGNPQFLPFGGSLQDDKANNIKRLFRVSPNNVDFTLNFTGAAGDCPTWLLTLKPFEAKTSVYVVLAPQGVYQTTTELDKPTEGTGEFSLAINLAVTFQYGNLTNNHFALCRVDSDDYTSTFKCNPRNSKNFVYWQRNYNDGEDDDLDDTAWSNDNKTTPALVYIQKPVRPGKWELFYMYNLAKEVSRQTISKEQLLVNSTGVQFEIKGQGGIYILVLTDNNNEAAYRYNLTQTMYQVVSDNTVSILWQIPQYVVLTAAEILFSITGYEFAYSQAAPSMKALVQALWLLTTAAGDTIIVIITLLKLFDNMAIEMFVYAGAMIVVIFIFALMSIFYYKYTYYTGEEAGEEPDLSPTAMVREEEEEEGQHKWNDPW